MIQDVDDYIQARLQCIQYGTTELTVYPYIPDREKGSTKYPSIAFERMYYKPDHEHARPSAQIFIPSVAQQTIQARDFSKRFALTNVTGPVSYTVKPYPTPIKITYEIHTLGSKQAHTDGLMEMVFAAFPPGYADVINTCTVTFWMQESQCVNELALPLYRTMVLLKVHGLYLDRPAGAITVPAITKINTNTTLGKKEDEVWQQTQQIQP